MSIPYPTPPGKSSLQVHKAAKLLRIILHSEWRPEKIAAAWQALVGECEIDNHNPENTRLVFNAADIARHLETIAEEVRA